MQTTFDPIVPGSPFQSSSHQTACSILEDDKSDRPEFKHALKRLRSQDNGYPGSPHHKPTRSNPVLNRVPNAPRPSLELNDENVLFANRHLLDKHKKQWRNSVIQGNTTLNLSSFQSTPAEHAALNNPLRNSVINVQKTSTPHMRRVGRRANSGDVFNSALIGAPRLALSRSLSSSMEDANESSAPGIVNGLSPTENMIAVSSFEEDQAAQNSDNHRNKSPLVQPSRVPRTAATAKKLLETSQLSNASNSQFRCRICLEEGDSERVLLSPCRCKGTVGLVHRHCLQRWVMESGKPNCELCGYAYIMTPSRRRSAQMTARRVTQRFDTFQNWIRLYATRRHLLTDVICLILLTPSTYIGVYFCVMGAMSYSEKDSISWQVIGLWFLAVLLVLLLTVWVILAIRHHWNNYERYRYYQRRRAMEEAERLAALPRWRFSIQPRPRGSSIYLHSISEPARITTDSVSYLATESHDTTTSAHIYPSQTSSEVELQTQILPGPSRERLHSTSQQVVVSVALSAVPEVTEEYSSPNMDKHSQESV